ncbi:unnamed protein product [Rhizoctonia solani]|uniref:DUF6532 domain-containing protein n=1 Tax=Rhizoctonia solani TaxID=456999 RepID=A0A8H3GZ42_9AGAM|nr:unnamed protein product [Rhizoctonia solani]
MPDNPDWQLSRDRPRRLNVKVPPTAIPSQQALAAAQQRNVRRDYGREIAARLPSPEVRHHADDEGEDETPTEDDFATEFLQLLLNRDAADYRAQYESGEISLEDLRGMVTSGRLLPLGSAGLNDHVNQSGPELLGQNVTASNPHAPTSTQARPVPIATDLRGNNAWPGITITPQAAAGTIVQSRFARDGYNPTTNVTDAPTIHHVPVSQPEPLRHTDRDTIVPGSPHPPPPTDSNQAPAQSVPATQAPSGTGSAAIATTHQQTNLGRVALDQPGEPPATAAPMTPTTNHSRNNPPPYVQNKKTSSQPAVGSKTAPGAAPIVTPAMTAPTGPTLTASHNHQTVGRNVHGGQGDIHFTTYNNANHPHTGYRIPATSLPDGRQLRSLQVHQHRPRQPQIASPLSNPFLDQNAPFPAPMSTGGMLVGPGVPLMTRNDAPPTGTAQRQAYQPLPMPDHPMSMAALNGLPVEHQAAMLATPPELLGSHFHSLPQATPQPHVRPQGVYSQPPLAHTAQPYAQRPLAADYGNVQQFSQALEGSYAPQYIRGHFAQAPNDAHPQPYTTSAGFPVRQAPVHRPQFRQHMGPALLPHRPPPVRPPVSSQAVPRDAAVRRGGASVGVPPGVLMDGIDEYGYDLEGDPANLPFKTSTICSYPEDMKPVARTFVATYRVLSLARGTYPHVDDTDEESHENLGRWCWDVANRKHQTNYPFRVDYLRACNGSVCASRCFAKNVLLSHTKHYFDLRQGAPEHNMEVKNCVLPHGIHQGNPEEGRRPMELPYLMEACRLIAFNSKRAIGFCHPDHFAPPSIRFLAYICTLAHHIIYAHRKGEFENEPLNAVQQEGTFKIYMDQLKYMQQNNPADLWNARMRIWDYCMRGLVEPDSIREVTPPPRVLSPDATELYVSDFSSHLPPGALDAAPLLPPQDGTDLTAQNESGRTLDEAMEPEDDNVAAEADMDTGEDEESWEIVTDDSGGYLLVGAHHTVQVDSSVVANIFHGHISAQEILDIAMDAAPPSTPQAGPSGLTIAEKESVTTVPGIARIDFVDSSDEYEPAQPNYSEPQTPQTPRLYNGRYLAENGGVERCNENEDRAYYAGKDARRDIEPITVSDEEMEWYQDG